MKTTTFILALAVGFCLSAPAQNPYSQNVVGYYNKLLYTGDNLIANPLSNSNNALSDIFNPGVPGGATFTKWDSAGLRFLPASEFDQETGWSINYRLTYGEGGVFRTPIAFTNTFVGGVWPAFSPEAASFVAPLVSSNGLFLLSCVIPLTGATFEQTVGRAPREGEQVMLLNASAQTWSTTTFQGGTWDQGSPVLGLGNSAFFNLGPTEVLESQLPMSLIPEPGTIALAALGGLILASSRRGRRTLDTRNG